MKSSQNIYIRKILPLFKLIPTTIILLILSFSLYIHIKNDTQSVYAFIEIATTLSGLTMVGGILKNKRVSEDEKDLFLLSIIFLMSAFLMTTYVGLLSTIGIQNQNLYLFTLLFLLIGVSALVTGYVALLMILMNVHDSIK